MSQVIGAYTKLLLCPEASYGKLGSSLDGKILSLPYNTNNLSASQKINDASTIRGRRDAADPILGNHDSSGDIDVPLDVNAFGWWLAAMFGSPTTTQDTSSKLYTHVFKVGDTMPSFTIEKNAEKNGVFLRTAGAMINKLALSFGGDNELTAKLSCIGSKETTETASLGKATAVDLRRLNQFQCNSLKLGGVETDIVTQLTLDIDFGLDTDGYAIGNGGYRSRVNPGVVKPSGKITAFFDDASLLKKANANEESSLEVALVRGDESLTIKIPELQYNYKSPDISGPSGVKQELDYHGYWSDSTDNSCVVFTLVNKTASYAFNG